MSAYGHNLKGKNSGSRLEEFWSAAAFTLVPSLAFHDIRTQLQCRTTFRRSLVASLVAQMAKKSTCNAGDPGLIPGSGRSPGGRHGNSLQYSCLENPMDRGAWWAPWV